MKTIHILIFLLFFSFSCSNRQKGEDETISITSIIKKQAIEIATGYAKSRFKDSISTTANGGITWITDKQKMYEINPNKIFIGNIDADSTADALITLNTSYGTEPGDAEHLIMVNKNGKLTLAKSFVMDLKILSLRDKIFSGEIHTKPRSSPLYNCEECRAIIRYKFTNGDTVRIE